MLMIMKQIAPLAHRQDLLVKDKVNKRARNNKIMRKMTRKTLNLRNSWTLKQRKVVCADKK